MLYAISKETSWRCPIWDNHAYNGYQCLDTGEEICFVCGEIIFQSMEHDLEERCA